MTESGNVVEVSRRIEAPASLIFRILASPERHVEFDGSDMLRGTAPSPPISGIGDVFNMKMHRLGRDYVMINRVVEFEPDSRIAWEPAPGDVETAGGDPAKVGVAAGYRWGYTLTTAGANATVVTETFDCRSEELRRALLREDGAWINGSNPVSESMAASLDRLEKVCRR